MHLFASKFVKLPEYTTELPGSVTAPKGFVAAGISAGLKKSEKRDLGLLISQTACTSAALYTPNAAAAAPIKVCRDELANGTIQGVVVNSGSANACTGAKGLEDARAMGRLAAAKAGIDGKKMAVASTGVIGQELSMEAVEPGIEYVAELLSEGGGFDFAEAIRTTDKIDKDGAVRVSLPEGNVTIGACAKGAGMIAPEMATLLAFVTTDAAVPADLLKEMLETSVFKSFNAITVDGDMSTNDFILIMANGQSGVTVKPGSEEAKIFAEAVASVCKGLALKMVADGEGATKVVELHIGGAASDEESAKVAKAISNSLLVKTAFYGRDPNWGRLMASAGAALAGEQELLADIYYEELCLAQGGFACEGTRYTERLKEIMSEPEISVAIDLHRGGSSHVMYFSDLTHDYVTLNAEYTT